MEPEDQLLESLRGQLSADAWEALRARLVAAERLSHVGRLAAGVAHELRNPLAVIETSVWIVKNATDDPRILRHVARITEQVGVASAIVGELLDAARERPLVRREVVLDAVCDEAIAWVPRRPEVAVLREGEGGPLRVVGDPRRLRQVLINLVSNALEAMAGLAAPRLTVGLWRDGDMARVTVRDTGPGIAPALLPRLFEPLVTTRPGGTGLGLALARDIVAAHQGTLDATNHPEGGACFTLRLPLEPAPEAHP
ncbi:MAG: hypothetical protein JNK72_10505 [Myxococcales bacterium]|nr:hypothetical protein [Myxococcales bacterium]